MSYVISLYFNEWMQQLKKSLQRVITKAFSSRYLLYTNTATATLTFIIGDLLEQRLEQITETEITSWNITRSAKMGIAGSVNGFIFHHWYSFIDKKLPATCIKTVVKKTVADMVIGSNLSILCLFAAVAILDNSSFEEFLEDYRIGWFPVYVSDLILWPTTQFVNFYFLPPKYRMLCVNLVTIVAAVFRSHVTHITSESHNKNTKR